MKNLTLTSKVLRNLLTKDLMDSLSYRPFTYGFVLMWDAFVLWYMQLLSDETPTNLFMFSILSRFALDHYVWDALFDVKHTPWD